jgi:anti-anti-sigma factor
MKPSHFRGGFATSAPKAGFVGKRRETGMRSSTARHTAPTVEIVITEELDADSVPRVAALLHEAADLHPARLVIDLAGCPFLDASAIGMLLDVHRRVWSDGGGLTLRAPGPRIVRTLRLARVDHVLAVDLAEPTGLAGPVERAGP